MSAPLPVRLAPGALGEFAAAGVLGAADVHVARRLGALVGETRDDVLLALALTVRSTRTGSVVLDLESARETVTPDVDADGGVDAAALGALSWPDPEPWTVACSTSRLTNTEAVGGAPLRMVGSRLWLDRYWRQEDQVARDLVARAARPPRDLDLDRLDADLAALFPDAAEQDQRRACAVVAKAPFGVVAGGPGTGKTTTVARLLTALYRQRPGLRVALAAPTGRAAARLQESVQHARGPLTAEDTARLTALRASTLHRLLGWRPGAASRFKHDRDNRLPYDVVVVDESSMIPLTLMARLLEALSPDTRLVLVGDPDQLASVEAGAVLGDVVAGAAAPRSPIGGAVAVLAHVHRFDAAGAIAGLAAAVRAGDADTAVGLLQDAPLGLRFIETPDDDVVVGAPLDELRALVVHAGQVVEAARHGDAHGALAALDAHRLLCAHRRGPRGERWWADQWERWLLADDPLLVPRLDGRYPGQPLLVTANDYENRLWNGDTGVVVERGGDLLAAFRRDDGVVTIPLVRLGDVRPLHAMTVHRAQGSQYREVSVLLPAADSPLATRQTFYTAVTRASSLVRVVGSVEAVRACVRREAARATGLRERLAAASS